MEGVGLMEGVGVVCRGVGWGCSLWICGGISVWRVWVCGGCGRFRCMEGVIIVKRVWGMYGIYVCGWIQSWIC